MKFFLHTLQHIRIINEEQAFTCTPADFVRLVPTYPGLPDGMVLRYWTPDQHYVSDGSGALTPDALDCLPYILNSAAYTLPCIYAHVTLSKNALCVSFPSDSIDFVAELKATADPDGENLPVDQEWVIRMRHETNMTFDAFRVTFVSGACHYTYQYHPGVPLGVWRLDALDFDRVTVAEQTYTVKLAHPVTVTLYRELT